MGLVTWDAVHNDSPDSHPLQTDRLYLRVVGIFFMALCFGIAGIVAFRSWRATTRLRKGLCLTCGYDLRASDGLCPECGASFDRSDPANPNSNPRDPLTRWQARILKVLAACDHWGFYLANVIGCGVWAFFCANRWLRVGLACFVLWDLYCLIRRVRKGPTDYERLFRENAGFIR